MADVREATSDAQDEKAKPVAAVFAGHNCNLLMTRGGCIAYMSNSKTLPCSI